MAATQNNMLGAYSTPDQKPKSGGFNLSSLLTGGIDLGFIEPLLGGGVPDNVEPLALQSTEDNTFLIVAVIMGGLLMAGVGAFILQSYKK